MAEFKPKGGGQLPGSMMDVASRAPGGGGGGGSIAQDFRSIQPRSGQTAPVRFSGNRITLGHQPGAEHSGANPHKTIISKSENGYVLEVPKTGTRKKFDSLLDALNASGKGVWESTSSGPQVRVITEKGEQRAEGGVVTGQRLDKPLRKARGGN
jgi:hypothetical protein